MAVSSPGMPRAGIRATLIEGEVDQPTGVSLDTTTRNQNAPGGCAAQPLRGTRPPGTILLELRKALLAAR